MKEMGVISGEKTRKRRREMEKREKGTSMRLLRKKKQKKEDEMVNHPYREKKNRTIVATG